MSRKRAFINPFTLQSSNEMEEYEFEYYSPGCYCTPQLITTRNEQEEDYSCRYYTQYCEANVGQWSTAANGDTYVVDAQGNVYYLSDYDNNLEVQQTLDNKLHCSCCNNNIADGRSHFRSIQYQAAQSAQNAAYTAAQQQFQQQHHQQQQAYQHPYYIHPSDIPPLRYCRQCVNVSPCHTFEEYEEEAVSPRKRERFESDEDSDDPNNKSYRTQQGYLVEEPSESDDNQTNVPLAITNESNEQNTKDEQNNAKVE